MTPISTPPPASEPPPSQELVAIAAEILARLNNPYPPRDKAA
jgi:hypothetical protein